MWLVALCLAVIAWAESETAFVEWAVCGRWRGERGSKRVALTFDDGPSDYTPQILDILKAHQVKATFFLTGENAERHPEAVGRMAEEGHSVGNHGYRDAAHPLFVKDPCNTVQGIVVTQEILERLTGKRPKLFRLPRARPRRDIWRTIRREGMTPVHASVVSLSESRDSSRSLCGRIVRRAKSGDIILLHDWPDAAKPPVLEALPEMIEGLEARGFELVTVPELFKKR